MQLNEYMKVGVLVMVKKFVAFVGVVILLMQFAMPAFAAGAQPASAGEVYEGESVAPLAAPTGEWLTSNPAGEGLAYSFDPDESAGLTNYKFELRTATKTDDGLIATATVATTTDVGKVKGVIKSDSEGFISAGTFASWGEDVYVRMTPIIASQPEEWSDFIGPVVFAYAGTLPAPSATLEVVGDELQVVIATPTDALPDGVGNGDVNYHIDLYKADGDVPMGSAAAKTETYTGGPVTVPYVAGGAEGVVAGETYYAKVTLALKNNGKYGDAETQTNEAQAPFLAYNLEAATLYKFVANGQTATLTDLIGPTVTIEDRDEVDVTDKFDLSYAAGGANGTIANGVWTVPESGDKFEVYVTATPKEEIEETAEPFTTTLVFYAASLGFAKAEYELELLQTATLDLNAVLERIASAEAGYAPAATALDWAEDTEGVSFDTNGVLKVDAIGDNVLGDTFDVTVSDNNNENITKKVRIKFVAPFIEAINWAINPGVGYIPLKLTSTATDPYYKYEVADLISVITPAEATATDIAWTVSDSSIVKLENGVLTGLKAGKATLTATVTRGPMSEEEPTKFTIYVSAEATPVSITPAEAGLPVNKTLWLQVAKAEGMGVFNSAFNKQSGDTGSFDLSSTGGYLKAQVTGSVGDEVMVRLEYDYIDFEDGAQKKSAFVDAGPYTIVGPPPTKLVLPKSYTINLYGRSLTNPTSTNTDIRYALTADLDPLGADAGKLTKKIWTTSNESVVELTPEDANELTMRLKPKKTGSAKITLEYQLEGASKSVKITTSVTVNAGADNVTINNASNYVATLAKPYANYLSVGKTITFKATVTNEITGKNAKDTSVTWVATPANIASIDAKGKLTAKEYGDVEVYAISQDANRVSAPVTIKVVQPVTSLATAGASTLYVNKGGSVTLSPVWNPEKGDVSPEVDDLNWKLSGKDAALFAEDSNGVVTATNTDAAYGKSVTVKATEPYTKKSVSYTVKVLKANETMATSTDIKENPAVTPTNLIQYNKTYDLSKDVLFFAGDGTQLNPAKNADKPSTQLVWESADPTAISVTNKGVIKGLNDWDGNPVKITAKVYRPANGTFGGAAEAGKFFELEWNFTVNKPITKVEVVQDGATKPAKTFTVDNKNAPTKLKLRITPATGATMKGYSWTGLDPAVATIGTTTDVTTFTYVGSGQFTPTVTVNTVDTKDRPTTKSVKVTVNAKHYAENTGTPEAFASAAYQGDNTVAVKKSVKLAVSFDSAVTEKTGIKWSSESPSIAKVNAGNGTVTGVAPGTTIINAEVAGGLVVPFDVKVVTAAEATSLGASASLKLLQKSFKVPAATATDFVLNAVLTPALAGRANDLGWTISDTTVVDFKTGTETGADVEFSVNPTAVKNQKATITVRDRVSGKTAAVTVTVDDASKFKYATGLTLSRAKANNVLRADGADTFYVGRSEKINARFTPSNATNKELVWSATYHTSDSDTTGSSAAAYITIDNLGNITPLKATADPAFVRIHATSQQGNSVATGSLDIEINQLAEKVTLTTGMGAKDWFTFDKTDAKGATVTVNFASAGATPTKQIKNFADLTWKSSSSSFKVTDSGNQGEATVTKNNDANAAASATITATTKDGGKVVGTFYVNSLGSNDNAKPNAITVKQGKAEFTGTGAFNANIGTAYKFTGAVNGTADARGKMTKANPSGIIWELEDERVGVTLKASTLTVTSAYTSGSIVLVARSVADDAVNTKITVTPRTPIAKVEATQSTVAVPFGGEVLVSARVNKTVLDPTTDTLDWSFKDAAKYGITFEPQSYNATLGVYQAKIKVDDVAKKTTGGVNVTVTNAYSGKKDSFKLVIYDPNATRNPFVPATGISINKNYAVMAPSSTAKFTASFTPANATNKGVTWLAMQADANASNRMIEPSSLSVSDPAVFSVDKSGNVKMGSTVPGHYYYIVAMPAGSQSSVLNANVIYSICEVRVGFSVTKIAMDKTKTMATSGIVEVTFTPVDALNKDLIWTSSNSAIIDPSKIGTSPSIVNDGVDTYAIPSTAVIGIGKVTLTATSVDGNKKASITVNVIPSV